MNAAAGRLAPYVLFLQALVGAGALSVYIIAAPGLLLLDADEARAARDLAVIVAALTEVVSLLFAWRRLSRVRYLLRALALGSRAYEADDLVELAGLPASVTSASVGTALALSALTVLPVFRPREIDWATAVSCFFISALVLAVAGLSLFALLREAVSGALELSAPEVAGDAVASLERTDAPRRRVLLHLLGSVFIPVSVVAVGAALSVHAHVRNAAIEARVDAAIALARAGIDVMPGVSPLAGQREALATAADAGFELRLQRAPSLFSVANDEGTIVVTVPSSEGHVIARFAVVNRIDVSASMAAACIIVLGLALSLGIILGRNLEGDLVAATRRVRQLGNEDVLRGEARIARPARFREVRLLGRSMELLAERFRVFAAAQERAIEAREAALRLRGLLFASVSHDLKSPLNAILGFCAVVCSEPLSDVQLESVGIVERRGRELLALIETILDAARVEAQRLTLLPVEVPLFEVIERAIEKGDDLGPLDASDVELSLEHDLPVVFWDEARMAQALAALIGHAKRLSPGGGVRVSARRGGLGVLLSVREPSGAFSVAEVTSLLRDPFASPSPGRVGGLALGLSLARSLVELHGGELSVAPHGEGCVLVASLPIRALTRPSSPGPSGQVARIEHTGQPGQSMSGGSIEAPPPSV